MKGITLTIEQVNEILGNFDEYSLNKKYTQVAKNEPEDYWREKYSGDNSEKTEVYRLGIDDLHLKVVRATDSYGSNESIKSVKIVRPIVKQITDFE